MDKEKIEQNKKEFIKIFNDSIIKRFPNSKGLLDWICAPENDFFTAPASTKFHLAEEGGLCQHSLNVYKRLLKLCKNEFGNNYLDILGLEDGELELIGLCHDLCKAQTYSVEYKNVKKYSENGTKYDDKGKYDWVVEPYYVVDEKFVYGHGTKSVFIIQSFIPDLTLNVALAIRFHMGGNEIPASPTFTDPTVLKAYEQFPICLLTHFADMEATFIDENEEYDFRPTGAKK